MQKTAIPSIVTTLRDALAPALSVSVSTKVPDPRPDSFVKIVQLSSGRLSMAHADYSVLFECWAKTQAEADALAEITMAHATSLNLDTVYAPRDCVLAGPYYSDDPDTGLPRTIFTVRFIAPMKVLS